MEQPQSMPSVATGKPAWFCLHSQPKHEHIAAAGLRQMEHVEVFLPRIRFKRATRQGPAWVTEALFPNYLFARFDWQSSMRRIQSARGIRNVVHFGDRWPTIADATIAGLREIVHDHEPHIIADTPAPGDTVTIVAGAWQGLQAVVSRVMSGGERIAVLMEFLGRQTMIEVPATLLLKQGETRATLL